MHKCPFFPTGVAAVFAQFKIDQFRSIAWYNVALGVALIILLFVIFHGESNCNKLPQRRTLCKTTSKKRKISIINVVISLRTVIRELGTKVQSRFRQVTDYISDHQCCW